MMILLALPLMKEAGPMNGFIADQVMILFLLVADVINFLVDMVMTFLEEAMDKMYCMEIWEMINSMVVVVEIPCYPVQVRIHFLFFPITLVMGNLQAEITMAT